MRFVDQVLAAAGAIERAELHNPTPRITVRIPDAMRMLGIGRSKLYELIKQGEIETVKLGGATLVIVESLVHLVERKRRR